MKRATAILGAAVSLGGCGHAAATRTPAAHPQTVTAAFTAGHMQVAVTVGSHVLVKTSHGECVPPTSSDPRVLAPDKTLSQPCAPPEVSFTARRAGMAEINGQVPCSGTACSAMRSWITVTVR